MSTYVKVANYTYTANITAYDPVTKLVTLDAPVNLSLGVNSFLGGDISSTYSINGALTKLDSAVQSGQKLSKPTTDEGGNYVAIFNVPSTTFQTGSKIFRIDNRTVVTDPTTVTTFAEGTFVASGLSTTSQKLDFSPSVDSVAQSFTQINQKSSTQVSTTTTVNVVNNAVTNGGGGSDSGTDPVAQSFIISKDNYPNGVFLNSIKLFFQSKPASNAPVTVSIIPTINGYPDGTALSYSTVTLSPSQVNVSANPHYLDSTSYTQFQFDAPVYVQSGVLYAIVIKSSSPDYNLYLAQQNQFAVPSTAKAKPTDANPANPTKIGAAPYVGSLFESQNAITWTADQSKDLMFVIDRCVFATANTAKIQFVVPKNLPFRKLATQDILYKLDANSVPQTSGVFSKSAKVDALNVTTTDFSPAGTQINYTYQSTLLNGNIPTPETNITPGRLGSPTPEHNYLSDGQGERVLQKASSNSFSLYATMSTNDPNVSPIISDDGVSLFTVRYQINNMVISNNTISLINGGNGYSSLSSSNITISTPDIGSNTATLGLTANANGAITSVYVTNPGSGYLTTPTVTVTGANNVPAVITIAGETSPKGGNAVAKYFTKKVVLSPGNDSGDLRVFYSAYRPTGTNVFVYYKILSSQDTQPFESGNWQLMTTLKGGLNIYSTSRDNVIEYECAPGIFTSGAANNNISYLSTNGQTYNSFIQFAIKVVLATNDNTTVPFLTDIRALALPPGTNI
jgi:hypothetical protein